MTAKQKETAVAVLAKDRLRGPRRWWSRVFVRYGALYGEMIYVCARCRHEYTLLVGLGVERPPRRCPVCRN